MEGATIMRNNENRQAWSSTSPALVEEEHRVAQDILRQQHEAQDRDTARRMAAVFGAPTRVTPIEVAS